MQSARGSTNSRRRRGLFFVVLALAVILYWMAAARASWRPREINLGHEACRLRFSSDGSLLVLGKFGKYGGLQRRDGQSGELQRELLLPSGSQGALAEHGNMIGTVSSDGRTISIARDFIGDYSWEILAMEPPRLQARLAAVGENVFDLAFSPDHTRLAAGSGRYGGVDLYSLPNGKRHLRAKWDDDRIVEKVAFSPDGKLLAVGEERPYVRIFDPKNLRLLQRLGAHDTITGLAWSPRGDLLAAGSADTLILWDTKTWRRVREIPGLGEVGALAFSPDGAWLAMASNSAGKVIVWDVATGQIHRELSGGWAVDLAFSPDGAQLATIKPTPGGTSTRLVLWRMK